MAKVNVYALERPYESKEETKTFEDPLQPGQPITLTLRGLTPVEQFAAFDLGQQLADTYAGDAPKIKVPAVGGKIPRVSSGLCFIIAQIIFAQCGDDDDKYSFEEFVGIAELFPNAFAQVQSWSESLLVNKVTSDPKGRTSGRQRRSSPSSKGTPIQK